jgi:hypothetical protein
MSDDELFRQRHVEVLRAARQRQYRHLCAICGMQNTLDNLSMCLECGDMVCSFCVVGELKRVRKCSCGGEIEE